MITPSQIGTSSNALESEGRYPVSIICGKKGISRKHDRAEPAARNRNLRSRRASFEWPANFPKVFTQTNGFALKSSPQYLAAKHGNSRAAAGLVAGVNHLAPIASLIKIYREAAIVCVRTLGRGSNQIPSALAATLARKLNCAYDDSILQLAGVRHLAASLAHRFETGRTFTGRVARNQNYLVVDDFVTSGGTFADLIAFIQRGGGTVIGAVGLAAAFSPQNGSSAQLSLLPETACALEAKFGEAALRDFLYTHGLTAKALTNVEARWLLSFRSLTSAKQPVHVRL